MFARLLFVLLLALSGDAALAQDNAQAFKGPE